MDQLIVKCCSVLYPAGARLMKYSTLCDDWYVNLNLNTEMDLHQSRETVLHFFEQVQKKYPTMRNFYNRERGEFVLEEEKDRGSYRWVSVELRRISSGTAQNALGAGTLRIIGKCFRLRIAERNVRI
jgi:hypothetical protein